MTLEDVDDAEVARHHDLYLVVLDDCQQFLKVCAERTNFPLAPKEPYIIILHTLYIIN
jgi:hypothetical protein